MDTNVKKMCTSQNSCNHIKKVLEIFQLFGLSPQYREKGFKCTKLEIFSRFLIILFVPLQLGATIYHTVILLRDKKKIDYASLALIYGTTIHQYL